VLDVFLKTERSKLVIRVIADCMSIVVSLWLTWYAWEYLLYALRVWKDSPTLYLPMFYAECSMFVGLMLMSLYVAAYLVKNTRSLLTFSKTEQGV
jgi:TRAP-type C4-dicarboxylate transport system permease small subunit